MKNMDLVFSGYTPYTYDGPAPGPEIALDHAKRRLFQYFKPKMSELPRNNQNTAINTLPFHTFGQGCLVIQMVDSFIPTSRTP
jgi:hypothetical protein